MKILFKNTTEYTKENYNQFVKFHTEKFGAKTLIRFALIGLCLIYILIANVLSLNWKFVGIFLITALIVYILNKLRTTIQTENRKKLVKDKKKFTFFFYENYIKVKCGRRFERIRYFEFHRIYKTEEYFFLYTDEDHSLILSKNGFEIGTTEEFDLFIKKKCPLKYKK